jgi:wyosine [tRNA(Phe)-imidazoG37] synthetase (radical SAM superfamily)
MDPLRAAFASHPRTFDGFRHVYPVVSRRSGGLSIGVNLNLDKHCNFDCPYCQVDRRVPSPRQAVDPSRVETEVRELLGRYASSGLDETYPGVPRSSRRLRDVALSGDGEPTMEPAFGEICARLATIQKAWGAAGGDPFQLVCITNATLLDRPDVARGLEILCSEAGEVWGKLDAGSEDWYQRVNVSRVPLAKVVENLALTARRVPLRIQTLWMEYEGTRPSPDEVERWLERVADIHARAPLRGVQVHTVARATSRTGCRPMELEWLEAVGDRVRDLGLEVQVHGGIDSGAIGDTAAA